MGGRKTNNKIAKIYGNYMINLNLFCTTTVTPKHVFKSESDQIFIKTKVIALDFIKESL